MSNNCMPLWRKAHLAVKMLKNCSLCFRSRQWRGVCKWVLQCFGLYCRGHVPAQTFFFESSLLWWYCPRHVLAHVFICCGILSLHSVIASGCVNGCAYVSFFQISVGNLCVSSDFKCLRFSEYLVCLFWSQMLTHSGSGWFLCTYLWHQMYSDAQVGNLFVSSDRKCSCPDLWHQMYSDAQVGNLFVSSDRKYSCPVHQDE